MGAHVCCREKGGQEWEQRGAHALAPCSLSVFRCSRSVPGPGPGKARAQVPIDLTRGNLICGVGVVHQHWS